MHENRSATHDRKEEDSAPASRPGSPPGNRTLCNPGDEVLIPSPSYPLFDFLAEIQDVKLVRYPLIYDNEWQIDFHALEQAITAKMRAVIVVHPNNPTGHFTKPSEMARLNAKCSARQMAIIADEVFL